MKRPKTLLILALTSCVGTFHLTDNAYYNIDDTSIRLVIQHPDDSLHLTNYEKTYNLPGHYCKKLETTDQLDTIYKTGIAIRFWTQIVMNERGSFYGPFAQNGLLHKIQDIEIAFVNGTQKLELTQELKGDSNITNFLWRNYTHKKLPISYYGSKNNGFKNPYFKNIEDWLYVLNHNADTLEELSHYDYIFWIDKETIKRLSFQPEELSMRINFIDTSGTKYRQLNDLIKIKILNH